MVQVMEDIGVHNFRAVSSDSTGNTRKARALLMKEFDWIIELPDSCHRLHLLAKDIAKIPYFADVRGGQSLEILNTLTAILPRSSDHQ